MTMCFTFKLMSSQVRHTALISTFFALLMASGFVFTEINSIFFVNEKKTWSFKVSFFPASISSFQDFIYGYLMCMGFVLLWCWTHLFSPEILGLILLFWTKKMRHIPDNQKLCICFQSTTIKKIYGTTWEILSILCFSWEPEMALNS